MKRLAIAVSLVFASSIQARDFLETYRLAVENDAQFAASVATLEARREADPIARSGLVPQLALSGSANRLDRRTEGSGSETFSSNEWGINLNQPIYRRDRWYQYKQAGDFVDQAEAEYETQAQGLILRVAQAYFDILAARDTLKTAKAQVRALNRQLDQAQQRYDVGLVAITDVLEVKATRDNAVSEEIQAQQQLDDANQALREIIATDPGDLAGVPDKLRLDPPQPDNVDAWEAKAFENNPGLKAAREAVEVAKKEVEIQRSGHYPALDLVAGYNDSNSTARQALDIEGSSVGVQLSVPIYTGGRVSSLTREARHNLTVARENLTQEQRALERQVADAYRGVLTSISRVNALNSARVANESSLAATQAGYEVGTRTIVDVLLVQRNFFVAERDYAVSRYGYILNRLLLEDAVGDLDEEDVRRVNNWLKEGN